EEVLTSVAVRPPIHPENLIAANDAGQVVFKASLGGVAEGILLYDNGVFGLLAGTGTPGPLPGGTVFSVDAPRINNRGDVLLRTGIDGQPGGALVLVSRGEKSFVLNDGDSSGGFENVRLCCHFVLNDEGEIAFAAQFQSSVNRIPQTGVFLRTQAGLQLVWSAAEPLQGLSGARSVDSVHIDRAGAIYFTARSATASALYKSERSQSPARIVGTGDSFGGLRVRNIFSAAAAPDGTVAVALDTESGQYVARILAGRIESIPLRNWGWRLAAGSNGRVAFLGDAGNGWGLSRWQGSSVSQLLREGQVAPNGEPIRNINSISITSDGKVFVQIATVENGFVVLQPGAANPLLFQAGVNINVAANMTISGLVAGSGAREPYVLMGGWNANLFALQPRGPIPVLISGDRMPGGSIFLGANGVFENTRGLHFETSGTTYRITGGRLELLTPNNSVASDGVGLGWSNLLAGNDAGVLLLNTNTNRDHQRLLQYDNGRTTVLAFGNGSASWQTPSPAGGVIRDWQSQSAMDSRGRVMIFFNVNNGPSGLFLFENATWRPVGLIDRTVVNNQVITGIRQVKAVNDRFYAVLFLRGGQSVLAEYRDRDWIPIVSSSNNGPNGAEIDWIGNFDVNRQGDIAFQANFRGGMTALVFRAVGGEMRMASANTAPEDPGDYIVSIKDVVLGDDRRVYFTALDVLDRIVLYVAEPLF
ncbi:MAG: hypothetical protein HY646_17825, partial [Acidobacteria bacterium]|nr:hypothetical protein [Acidobacteriota bacterium]